MCSFSQTTYPKLLNDSLVVITPQQLKQTNLIFLEHQKLKFDNQELSKEIISYNNLVDNYKKSDSIRIKQLNVYETEAQISNKKIQEQSALIDKLKAKVKTWKKWTVGGFSLSAVLAALLFIR